MSKKLVNGDVLKKYHSLVNEPSLSPTIKNVESEIEPKYLEVKTSGNITNYVLNNETRIKWLEDNFKTYSYQLLI